LKAKEELESWPSLPFRTAVAWLPETADAKADASLFMWRPGFEAPDEEMINFEGSWTGGKIAKWAKKGVVGRVQRFFFPDVWTPDNIELWGYDGMLAIVLDDDSEEGLKPGLEAQLPAFTTSHSRIAAASLKRSALDEFSKEYFNPNKVEGPTVTAIDFLRAEKYLISGHDELAKPDILADFWAKVKVKKIEPVKKSAPAPEEPEDEIGRTTVVYSTFDSIVMDPKKWVIVDYYTPSCEECNELDTVWGDVAYHVMNSKLRKAGLRVAKYDVAANYAAEPVSMVPKIVLYPAVKSSRKFKDKKVFTGLRKFDDIMEFIKDAMEEEGEL